MEMMLVGDDEGDEFSFRKGTFVYIFLGLGSEWAGVEDGL